MKRLHMLLIAAMFTALVVPAAWGQMSTVKGTVKGTDGKPFVGGTIELTDKEGGHKVDLKVDKNGGIFSLAVPAGTYDVTIITPDGKAIYQLNGFPVKSAGDNALDIDLQKEMQRQGAVSEEQKKQEEKVKAENQKIGKLNDLLKQSRADMQTGNFTDAKNLMLQATQADPGHAVLWFNLAEAQAGEAGKATDANEKKSGLQAAIESYNKALPLTKPTQTDMLGAIHNNMGQAYAKMGDIENASKEYDAAATADPTKAGMYYFNEGAVLTNSSKYDAAIAAFDKAIAADPNKADAYYQKGVNMLGKATTKPDGSVVAPEGTAEAFNKYLELAPTGPYADQAKQMLAMIGGKVETSFGKGKATKKK